MSSAIRKNTREEIRVEVSEFNGRRLISIRVWFVAEGGEWRPGKQGIAFNPALLPEMIEALRMLGEDSR